MLGVVRKCISNNDMTILSEYEQENALINVLKEITSYYYFSRSIAVNEN